MANRDRSSEEEGKRALAVQRLNEVVKERRDLRGQQAMAKGTSTEGRANVSLRAVADDGP